MAPVMALSAACAFGQTGTYRLQLANGASGAITVMQASTHVDVDIFAAWNTSSSRTGLFDGAGTLLGRSPNQSVTLRGSDGGPDCNITLAFARESLAATFSDCMAYNLPEDFSGTYGKISSLTKGDYVVAAKTSYFYKERDAASREKAYVVAGDKIAVENIFANGWAYARYRSAAHETEGYVLLSTLTGPR
jgi:hypothetical protein